MSVESKQPIIIVSAARSGSKLLRSILASSKSFSVCAYDANYVWKYGNYGKTHDELLPGDLTPRQSQRIREFFDQMLIRQGKPRLLEKTVSNSLRIPFVRKIYPDAKFIHLYRDGHAAVSSTCLCWQEGPASGRLQSREARNRKLKEFPFRMAWRYLVQYGWLYTKKQLAGDGYVQSWGPRYSGIDKDVQARSLIDVCAIQWARCVEMAAESLSGLAVGGDYINISYEDLVAEPAREVERVASFVDIPDVREVRRYANDVIDPGFCQPGRYSDVGWTSFALERMARAEAKLSQLVPEDRK